MIFALALSALSLAYANGANDDFKGVATLYGGKVLSYRAALIWAVTTTAAGCLTSILIGARLLKLFSGKGLVAESILSNPAFLISVALGAALTVLLATILGFPISTTHGLVGALAGAGIASDGLLSFSVLGTLFLVPLLAGPVIATSFAWGLYSALHAIRVRLGIESSFCLCVGARQEAVVGAPGLYTIRTTGVQVALEEEQYCRTIYSGSVAGVNVQRVMDTLHGLTAGCVSFARGLNDTPKIAALLLFVPALPIQWGILLITVVMAIGGLLHSRKIAERMSFQITEMNPGSAFTGNFVTSVLVILASLGGFPLSTTHVSCGAIFGIGVATRQARIRTIAQILAAWVTTLPLAALLSALLWLALR